MTYATTLSFFSFVETLELVRISRPPAPENKNNQIQSNAFPRTTGPTPWLGLLIQTASFPPFPLHFQAFSCIVHQETRQHSAAKAVRCTRYTANLDLGPSPIRGCSSQGPPITSSAAPETPLPATRRCVCTRGSTDADPGAQGGCSRPAARRRSPGSGRAARFPPRLPEPPPSAAGMISDTSSGGRNRT